MISHFNDASSNNLIISLNYDLNRSNEDLVRFIHPLRYKRGNDCEYCASKNILIWLSVRTYSKYIEQTPPPHLYNLHMLFFVILSLTLIYFSSSSLISPFHTLFFFLLNKLSNTLVLSLFTIHGYDQEHIVEGYLLYEKPVFTYRMSHV